MLFIHARKNVRWSSNTTYSTKSEWIKQHCEKEWKQTCLEEKHKRHQFQLWLLALRNPFPVLCGATWESLISVVDKTPKVMHQPNLNQHPPSLPFCQTTVLTFNSSNADLYNRSTSCSNRFKDYLSWENWVVLPPSSSGWPCVRSIT